MEAKGSKREQKVPKKEPKDAKRKPKGTKMEPKLVPKSFENLKKAEKRHAKNDAEI